MRLLERNMTKCWIGRVDSVVERIDIDGFNTGEFDKTYSKFELSMIFLPSNGDLENSLFGKTCNFEMIGIVDNQKVKLTSLDKLYLSNPMNSSDFENFDYSISDIKESLNQNVYGFVRRV